MDPFTVAAVGSMVYGAYSSYTAGKQQQAAYEAQAAEQERLASLIMQDFEANKKITQRKGDVFLKQQQSAYAKSGVDISTGSPLLAMEDSISAIQEQIEMDKRKAIADATAARAGANISSQQGSAAAQAGQMQAASGLLQGFAGLMK